MTRREKTLIGLAGALAVAGLGFVLVKNAYFDALARWDDQRVRWGNDYAKLQRQNAQSESRAQSLRAWAARTFDTDELRASAKLGAALLALVERAGLSPEKLSVQPVRGSQVKNAYREVGRAIRVRGGLKNIVDFLYLLDAEPHLHRLDQVTITPILKSNEVDLQVRYVTPVIDLKPEDRIQTDQSAATAPAKFDAEARKLYDPIASRDLFRPYIQRIVVPPPPPAPPPAVATYVKPPRPAPAPRTPAPIRFRVVGLPDWTEKQEVFVTDSATSQVRSYKPGDTLGGGVIALVDYRPMPSRDNPNILSPSRVILKVGPDYFAVELGQELTDRRRLPDSMLPDEIRPGPQTAPAQGVENAPPSGSAGEAASDDSVKKNAPAER
jgi:hypothetical protein